MASVFPTGSVNGVTLMKAETREVWSRPIQASIEVPMDIFRVDYKYGPNVQIRLDDDRVYVNVMAHDHGSYLKAVTVDYEEFVRKVGEAFFGEDWYKSN